MTPAVARFEQLRSGYAAAIPPSKHTSRKRRRELAWAAALSLLIESVAQEVSIGLRREWPELDHIRRQIEQHLRAANSKATFDTRGSR